MWSCSKRQSQGARTTLSEVVFKRTNQAASRVNAHRGFRRRLCTTVKTKRAQVVALLLRQGASEPEISTKSHRSAGATSSTVWIAAERPASTSDAPRWSFRERRPDNFFTSPLPSSTHFPVKEAHSKGVAADESLETIEVMVVSRFRGALVSPSGTLLEKNLDFFCKKKPPENDTQIFFASTRKNFFVPHTKTLYFKKLVGWLVGWLCGSVVVPCTFCFSSPDPFFQFPRSFVECGGLCSFSSFNMSSRHTFGLSGHLVKPGPPPPGPPPNNTPTYTNPPWWNTDGRTSWTQKVF